jgi:DNA mismatch repair protein MutL
MSDIIKLLPDSVANQIAAGEVIQRPASAVKEMLENAVDSGADNIHLIIREGGRNLIQVIDNGCGMSATDARLAFERHATSKISKAEDLLQIRTMGFRGEALASIASIAQVEIKTRQAGNELGTLIRIEGSRVKEQDAISCPEGTSISVKNLFFNVPARRNFLKSQSAESRHILEEFSKVALAWPQLSFTFTENERIRYQLPAGSLKDRIIRLFGNQFKENLVEVDSSTQLISISGFVGKPEVARKTRGEQYFMVNRRFIRHPYLHHAVENGFEGLLGEGSFPSYFLFIEIDPARIDVNIHPTKSEVNFQDAQVIYHLMKVAIRQSLGKYSVTPSLEFDSELGFEFPMLPTDRPIRPPSIQVDSTYNPFKPGKEQNWQRAYDIPDQADARSVMPSDIPDPVFSDDDDQPEESSELMQIQGRYILSPVKSGLLIIDQHLAHERILFEKFMGSLSSGQGISQQKLFPHMMELQASDAMLLHELLPGLLVLGFDINHFGNNSFIINGSPAGMEREDPARLIESLLEQYKKDESELKLDTKVKLARSLASALAIPYGKRLGRVEMRHLVDELFACSLPETAVSGKSILSIIGGEELQSRFKKS